MEKKYPNEPEHKNLTEQRQWEYDNLSDDELEERGWWIVDKPVKWISSVCPSCDYFHDRDKGTCAAYPNGIPDRYTYKAIWHESVQEDQTGDFVVTFNKIPAKRM